MKKALSIILSFVILLSIFSTSVFANDTGNDPLPVQSIDIIYQDFPVQIHKSVDMMANMTLMFKYKGAFSGGSVPSLEVKDIITGKIAFSGEFSKTSDLISFENVPIDKNYNVTLIDGINTYNVSVK